jgi:hypothetical protein
LAGCLCPRAETCGFCQWSGVPRRDDGQPVGSSRGRMWGVHSSDRAEPTMLPETPLSREDAGLTPPTACQRSASLSGRVAAGPGLAIVSRAPAQQGRAGAGITGRRSLLRHDAVDSLQNSPGVGWTVLAPTITMRKVDRHQAVTTVISGGPNDPECPRQVAVSRAMSRLFGPHSSPSAGMRPAPAVEYSCTPLIARRL